MAESDDLRKLADALPGWDRVDKQPESAPGQLNLFESRHGLTKRQRVDFERGQDFLFNVRGDDAK